VREKKGSGATHCKTGGDLLKILANVREYSVRLDGLLGLEHRLHISIALHEPLAVEVPLLDVLLPASVDSLQQSLQFGLLLLAELSLHGGRDARGAAAGAMTPPASTSLRAKIVAVSCSTLLRSFSSNLSAIFFIL
jgi:hypothetical protein